MGKYMDRTVKNWRWWVVLPTVPLVMALCLLQWMVKLVALALENAEHGCGDMFRWARKGWK